MQLKISDTQVFHRLFLCISIQNKIGISKDIHSYYKMLSKANFVNPLMHNVPKWSDAL